MRPLEARNRKLEIGNRKSTLAWQGIRIDLPPRWNPVKLEGDFSKGHALLVDLHRPRLGLRWHKPKGRRFDAEKWARQAMREEVGMLAAEEAVEWTLPAGDWEASLLYVEPDPPGRDVWLGFSRVSGRCVQVVHHAHRREQMLAKTILPTLVDAANEQRVPWSVFELSCMAPAGMKLAQHHLNAGDLSLRFVERRKELIIRQVAVAQLALKRLPLEKWLGQQMQIQSRHYRPLKEPEEAAVEAAGRTLSGLKQWMRRRRRFGWARWLPERVVTYALHDQVRDRLLLVQGTDEQLVKELAATAGWAAT